VSGKAPKAVFLCFISFSMCYHIVQCIFNFTRFTALLGKLISV
jgi:hypothetical protein